jgi:chromate transporter
MRPRPLKRSFSLQTHTLTPRPRPGLGNIFITFFVLGIQSFGGGSSTFFLIHQVCIDRGWMDEETFVRDWALAQISPGINLLKLTILVGRRLRGWPGLLSAAAGLLFPSAAVTALMTAGFSAIQSAPLVRAVLKGVLPATIGLSLAMGVQMGQPLLARAQREGKLRLTVHILILAAAALLMAANALSPVLVLLLAGAVTMLVLALIPIRPVQKQDPSPEQSPQ